jgi:hypothetical protein
LDDLIDYKRCFILDARKIFFLRANKKVGCLPGVATYEGTTITKRKQMTSRVPGIL